MKSKPAWWYVQSGIIAYRLPHNKQLENKEELEVLLISSSKGKRWVIPKGIVEPDMSPQASAVKEAFEEAGITGRLWEQRFGVYTRKKWGGMCTVDVFVLQVTAIFEKWPECWLRKRQWMSVDQAVRCVRETQLKNLFNRLPEFLTHINFPEAEV